MGERIDGIAKVLGARTSRRVVFAIVAGALLEGTATDRTEATRKGKRRRKTDDPGICPEERVCGPRTCCREGLLCHDASTGDCRPLDEQAG